MILFSSQNNARWTKRLNKGFKDAGALKILSWNIYMLPYLSLFNDNAKRAKAIAERLNGSDAHILVFQEAFSSKCRNIDRKVQSFVSSNDSDETHLSDHYGLEVSIQF
jgi:hypothetical protein